MNVLLHEAGHAVAAVLLGIPVVGVDAEIKNEPGVRGRVRILYDGLDREQARDQMTMILAGPIMGGGAEDIPRWPLDPEAPQSDERLLGIYASHLDMDQKAYSQLVIDSLNFTTTDRFCQLFEAVTGVLEERPQIDANLLYDINQIARSQHEDR